jgi:hypothetical protein
LIKNKYIKMSFLNVNIKFKNNILFI